MRLSKGIQAALEEPTLGFRGSGGKRTFNVVPRIIKCACPPMQFAEHGIPKVETGQPGRRLQALGERERQAMLGRNRGLRMEAAEHFSAGGFLQPFQADADPFRVPKGAILILE